jgi:hypothetical protein
VPEFRYAPQVEHQALAESLLGGLPCRTVSLAEAERLLGSTIQSPSASTIALLRAVDFAEQGPEGRSGGTWKVRAKGGTVVTQSFCGRIWPWNLRRRRALIAFLDDVPSDVYVETYIVYGSR